MPLIDHFPSELGKPRKQQHEALTFVENVFRDVGTVVLELSVGAGKSGVAMTVSRAHKGGIVACPTVQLQGQYCSEFEDVAPLLGRARFPCLKRDPKADESIPIIRRGEIPKRPDLEFSCAHAPCLNKPKAKQQRIKAECDMMGGCPYQHHLDYAQTEETIVSNLHSLMYSVALSDKISKRKVLVIDECHDLEAFMRSFMSVKLKIRRKVDHRELSNIKTVDDWVKWLTLPQQTVLLLDEDRRDSYAARIEKLSKSGEVVHKYWDDEKDGQLWIEIIPVNVAGACRAMLFSLADKIVLMSGTIYHKEMFLRPLGAEPDKAAFLRLPSDFKKENRKVVLPRIKDLDLSHKNWDINLYAAIQEIYTILDAHENEKGVIHTNSYRMTRELVKMLNSDRIISHESHDFQQKLKEFYASEGTVFISPVCSQGIDFKGDAARFQIIVRPSYGAITEPYNKYLLSKNFWHVYNYEAAKVFGQTLGRIVRSHDDYGVTYLLSSSFMNLIQKTNHLLPLWLKQSFVKNV